MCAWRRQRCWLHLVLFVCSCFARSKVKITFYLFIVNSRLPLEDQNRKGKNVIKERRCHCIKRLQQKSKVWNLWSFSGYYILNCHQVSPGLSCDNSSSKCQKGSILLSLKELEIQGHEEQSRCCDPWWNCFIKSSKNTSNFLLSFFFPIKVQD